MTTISMTANTIDGTSMDGLRLRRSSRAVLVGFGSSESSRVSSDPLPCRVRWRLAARLVPFSSAVPPGSSTGPSAFAGRGAESSSGDTAAEAYGTADSVKGAEVSA